MKKKLKKTLLKFATLWGVFFTIFNDFLNNNFDRNKMRDLSNNQEYREKILGNL
jgi:hypothetical protein